MLIATEQKKQGFGREKLASQEPKEVEVAALRQN
jgi:hypothetical protein